MRAVSDEVPQATGITEAMARITSRRFAAPIASCLVNRAEPTHLNVVDAIVVHQVVDEIDRPSFYISSVTRTISALDSSLVFDDSYALMLRHRATVAANSLGPLQDDCGGQARDDARRCHPHGVAELPLNTRAGRNCRNNLVSSGVWSGCS
jgi:hypothetical protein